MNGYSKPSTSLSKEKEQVPLEVKPIRTLSPYRPPSFGLNPILPPIMDSPSFSYVTPFGSFAKVSNSTSSPNFLPMFPIVAQTEQQTPLYAIPLMNKKLTAHIDSNEKGKTMDEKKPKREKPSKIYDRSLILPNTHNPRESVETILMTFDALRRRVQQLELEGEGIKSPDVIAGSIMADHGLKVNVGKRVGVVPGVEVGDIFYFRFEMNLIGLHSQTMSGIDISSLKFGDEEDNVAICIVSSGYYDNDVNDVDTIIYSGQDGTINDDQRLEKGNLALERSFHRNIEVRVIRGVKDFNSVSGKIYIYDGVYKIHEAWVDKSKTGFKFKLVKEPRQPIGYAVWKMTESWLANPLCRGRVILHDISSGSESIPICLVNEVDSEKEPSNFTYISKVEYLTRLSSLKPVHDCTCIGVCLPGDVDCFCAQENEGHLPYSASGILVSRKPLIYECSSICSCAIDCRNRITQRGIKLKFEVFKTNDRGWGLRSWHPIRAGTFICEYVGEVIDKITLDIGSEHNEYIFHGLIEDKTFRWNYIPELLDEFGSTESIEAPKALPFVINAKKMGNIARFMNHSCSPNVFWQPVQYDHSDEEYPHIMFFATKHIPPMTELTYDYGLSTGDPFVGSWRTKKCLCGSSKCRGVFG